MKPLVLALFLASGLAGGCATTRDAAPVIDGSSAAAAEASWARMLESVPPRQRMALIQAMAQINLAGVQSAYEIVRNDELKNLTIVRIRDQVDGMDAAQIIALGERVGTVEIERVDD